MAMYKKLPVVIEAHKIGDDDWPDSIWEGVVNNTIKLILTDHALSISGFTNKHVSIKTLEGTMIGYVGDYIIRGVSGEFYPCKPDIFNKTYERFNPTTP